MATMFALFRREYRCGAGLRGLPPDIQGTAGLLGMRCIRDTGGDFGSRRPGIEVRPDESGAVLFYRSCGPACTVAFHMKSLRLDGGATGPSEALGGVSRVGALTDWIPAPAAAWNDAHQGPVDRLHKAQKNRFNLRYRP